MKCWALVPLPATCESIFAPGDPDGVNAAATSVLTALRQCPQNSAHRSSPYIAPETFWNYEDSLTLLAPLARNLPAVVWRASIYKETAPLTAVWSATPTQTVEIATTFAAVCDGRGITYRQLVHPTPLHL